MGTTKTASARALIEPHIKKEAEAILKDLGLQCQNPLSFIIARLSPSGGCLLNFGFPIKKL